MYDELVTTAKTGTTLAATGGSVATGTLVGAPLWLWAVGAVVLGAGAYVFGSRKPKAE